MKNQLLVVIAICAMLFASCSNENELKPTVNSVVFELKATDHLDNGFDTRTGLYSQTPVNNVDMVTVYAFKNDGNGNFLYARTFNITGWTKGLTTYRHEVPQSEILTGGGTFKFIAVGRNNTGTDGYTIATPTAQTNFNNFLATGFLPAVRYDIFAGNTDEVVIPADGSGIIPITMTRKVAGILGYFSNVPTTINNVTVGRLAVIMEVTGNSAVNLVTGVGSQPSVNNFSVVGFIDLTQQGNDGNFYTGNNTGVVGMQKLPNTQLDGFFIYPMTGARMVLQLTGTNNVLLKEWPIVNESGAETFDLVANHLYSIGSKPSTTSTNNDNPINLSKDEIIVISIDADWNTIHDLNVTNLTN